MTPTIVILNVALIALVVGVIVGMHLWAIKTSPSEEHMIRLARQTQRQRRTASATRSRTRIATRPVYDS